MGDNTTWHSAQAFFETEDEALAENKSSTSYMHKEYTISVLTNRRKDMTLNIIARMRNALVKGVNNQGKIPKWVIIWPENDIINDTKQTSKGDVGYTYGKLIDWLMKEMKSIMQDALNKSYPMLQWILKEERNYLSSCGLYQLNITT